MFLMFLFKFKLFFNVVLNKKKRIDTGKMEFHICRKAVFVCVFYIQSKVIKKILWGKGTYIYENRVALLIGYLITIFFFKTRQIHL